MEIERSSYVEAASGQTADRERSYPRLPVWRVRREKKKKKEGGGKGIVHVTPRNNGRTSGLRFLPRRVIGAFSYPRLESQKRFPAGSIQVSI